MSAEFLEKAPMPPTPETAGQPDRVMQLKQAMEYSLITRAQETNIEAMAEKADLLEDLGDRPEDEAAIEPALTVCIPVAVTKEEPATVMHTVELVKRSQQELGKPVDVIVWANAKYAGEDSEAATQEAAQANYVTMQEMLKPADGEGLRIQTALEVLPEEEATMVKLRSNYMDALSVQAAERGYGVDHPVLWMDADTTMLSPAALGKIEASVRNFDAMVVHTNLRYNLDWANGTPLGELDDASKAVAIHEIHRRQRTRFEEAMNTPDSGAALGYNDEPGTAFALGSYLAGGGLHQPKDRRHTFDSGVDEARILETNMRQARQQLPNTLFKDGDPQAAQHVTYVQDARMGVSNRRLYRDVQDHGTQALETFKGFGYELATDRPESAQAAPAAISGAELKEMLSKGRTRERSTPLYSEDPALRESMLAGGFTDPTPKEWRAYITGARIVDRLIDEHLPDEQPKSRDKPIV